MRPFLSSRRKWNTLCDTKYFTFVHRKIKKERQPYSNLTRISFCENVFSDMTFSVEGNFIYTLDFTSSPSRVHINDFYNKKSKIDGEKVCLVHHLRQKCALPHYENDEGYYLYPGKGKSSMDSVIVLGTPTNTYVYLISKSIQTPSPKRFIPVRLCQLGFSSQYCVEWKSRNTLIFFNTRGRSLFARIVRLTNHEKSSSLLRNCDILDIGRSNTYNFNSKSLIRKIVFLKKYKICILDTIEFNRNDSVIYIYSPEYETMKDAIRVQGNNYFPTLDLDGVNEVLGIYEPWKDKYLPIFVAPIGQRHKKSSLHFLKYNENGEYFETYLHFDSSNFSWLNHPAPCSFVLSKKKMFVLDKKGFELKMYSIMGKKLQKKIPFPFSGEGIDNHNLRIMWDHDRDGIILTTEREIHVIKILNKKKIDGRSRKYLKDDVEGRISFITKRDDCDEDDTPLVLTKRIVFRDRRVLFVEYSLLLL